MLFRLIIAVFVVTASVTGFHVPRLTMGRLSIHGQHNKVQVSPTVLQATTALQSTLAPSTGANIVQKFMAASLRKKAIFLLHPVAMIAVAFLLKVLVGALVPIVASAILRLKDAVGLKTAKRFGVDNSGKRFYGIAKPIKQTSKRALQLTLPAQKPSVPALNKSTPAPTPKKVAVAGATPKASASVAQAKARVVSILAALDEATIKASKKVVEVQSKSLVSFNSIMGLDAEKAGRDAYLAKIKQQERERTAKLAKAKALEMAKLDAKERAAKIAAKDAEARKRSEDMLKKEEEKKAQIQAEALERKRKVEEAYILAAAQAQKVQTLEKAQEVVFSVKSTTKPDWSPHFLVATKGV